MTLQPLSQTQRYFLGVMIDEGFNPTWQHVALALRLRGRLDPGRVAAAARALAERHPLLATRLIYRAGEPYLEPAGDPQAACEVIELDGASDDELDLAVARRLDAPFDALSGPLWRLVVASSGPRTSIVAFVCHHLVGDGIGAWILVKDFGALYFGGDLDPVPPSYAEYVAEEQAMLAGPEGDRRLAHWGEVLDGARPRLELDARPGEGELTSRETVGLRFADGVTEGLLASARAHRVTPLALLSGAMFTALKRATGDDDVLAASVTDVRGGRYAGTVGVFSDLMLVRDPAGADDERTRLARLRNAYFGGWRSHLPVAHLRERLPCFVGAGLTASNPCDVFLNFIPVRTSSDWFALLGSYGASAPEYYAPRNRIGAPSRRFAPPLLFVSFVHAMELSGWIDVHRTDEIVALGRTVAGEIQAATTPLAAAPAG